VSRVDRWRRETVVTRGRIRVESASIRSIPIRGRRAFNRRPQRSSRAAFTATDSAHTPRARHSSIYDPLTTNQSHLVIVDLQTQRGGELAPARRYVFETNNKTPNMTV
jgi:hypothetical protein